MDLKSFKVFLISVTRTQWFLGSVFSSEDISRKIFLEQLYIYIYIKEQLGTASLRVLNPEIETEHRPVADQKHARSRNPDEQMQHNATQPSLYERNNFLV